MAGKKQGAIVKWDADFAAEAEAAAQAEANTGGGKFISVRGGVLTWNGAAIPGNKMAVIVLDAIFENAFYEGEFDPDSPTSPTCFAFGRVEKELSPHEIVVEAGSQQNEQCAGCEKNEFGSADKGKGKACKNTRRLALIPAGQFDAKGKFKLIDDPDYYLKGEHAFIKLPVTSVAGWAKYVKQLKDAVGRPPYAMITQISVQPDPKSQFKLVFEAMQNVNDKIGPAVVTRRKEMGSLLMQPYQLNGEREEKPAKGKKGGKKSSRY